MIKLSKKELKELAQSLSAFYCGGNVYNHENIRYYVCNKDITKLNEYTTNKNQVYELIEYLASKTSMLKNNEFYITANQIAYSCGTYGNTAQLVKYDIVDSKEYTTIATFYTYYC